MVEMMITVNGRPMRWGVSPGETLLEALRRHNIKGPKLVCGTGDCCACGVIIAASPFPEREGGQGVRSINACCMLALQAQGAHVLTVEGLATGPRLHAIQEAFAQAGAAQCGYCTPGFIIRTYALLQENPDPTEADVRAAFAGNICRCTGYVKPVEAALRAASMLRLSEERGAGG
jgi:aerobic-type carbon monoxide dehydrogenase small subunit (CoxS/CutS family)